MWKSNEMMVLETMDYSMRDIVKNGPHAPMYRPMKANVKEGDEVKKFVHKFNDAKKHIVVLDVRACVAIRNSLPYEIYHFVQNFRATMEMMDTPTVDYEGADEVKFVNRNSLNRRYEHISAK